jgi:hypothetical protein
LESFSYELQFDMHFYMHSYLHKNFILVKSGCYKIYGSWSSSLIAAQSTPSAILNGIQICNHDPEIAGYHQHIASWWYPQGLDLP